MNKMSGSSIQGLDEIWFSILTPREVEYNLSAFPPAGHSGTEVKQVNVEMISSIFENFRLIDDRIEPFTKEEKKEKIDENGSPTVERMVSFLGSNSKSSLSRPFTRGFSLFKNDGDEWSVQLSSLASIAPNILSAIKTIFMGYEIPHFQQDSSKLGEIKKKLKNDKSIWKLKFKDGYKKAILHSIEKPIQGAFNRARNLVENRSRYSNQSYYLRFTLYATGILAMIGKLLGQRHLMIAALAISGLTAVGMFIQYRLILAKQSGNVKSLNALKDEIGICLKSK